MTDQFESEQKRVAALRAAAGLPVYERAATSQQRAPLYTAQPVTEEERDTLHSAAPQTVVQPDASTDGHAPAEETIASRASFSTALIVIIALIAVCVVLLIAYFFYQYRAQFGQWSARMFEKMKFTT